MTSPTLRPWRCSLRRRPKGRTAAIVLGLPLLALPLLAVAVQGVSGELAARMAAGVGWQTAQGLSDGASGEGLSAGAAAPAENEDETPDFFEDLDDLPLMEGLQEMQEASMAFDKPGGRIGEVYAEGAVPADQVRGFYAQTLPQFGWQPVAENRYERDGERLVVDVSERAGTTTLRISLSPTD